MMLSCCYSLIFFIWIHKKPEKINKMQMNDIMIITKYFKCAYFFLFRQTQESMPGGQMKNFFWLFKVRFHYIILHVNLSSYNIEFVTKRPTL